MTTQSTPNAAAARRLPLNQRIIWARRRKGISQERLAEQIGTSRRHMIRIEKGQHRPGPGLRARIAVATEQTEEFFNGDEDDEESDPVADLMTALQRVFVPRHEFEKPESGASLAKATPGSRQQGA